MIIGRQLVLKCKFLPAQSPPLLLVCTRFETDVALLHNGLQWPILAVQQLKQLAVIVGLTQNRVGGPAKPDRVDSGSAGAVEQVRDQGHIVWNPVLFWLDYHSVSL